MRFRGGLEIQRSASEGDDRSGRTESGDVRGSDTRNGEHALPSCRRAASMENEEWTGT